MIWIAAALAGLSDCERRWRDDPADPAVWQCVYQAGAAGQLAEALDFTVSALASGPVTAQMHLTHANLLGFQRADGVTEALERALVAFREAGDTTGQVKTHLNLANELRHQGRIDEGRAQLEAAATVAADTQPLAGMVAIERSRWTCDLGGDYAAALRTLLSLDDRLADPRFPPHGKMLIHHTRRCLADRLGRSDEARDHGEALLAFAEEAGNRVLAVVTRDNLLWTEHTDGAGPGFAARVDEALAAAQDVGHPPTIADLTCLRATITPDDPFDACLEAAGRTADRIGARAWTLAAERAIAQGEEELASMRLAVARDLAETAGALEARIDVAVAEARWADRFSPRDAIARGHVAVERVRDLREHQVDGLVRSRVVSGYAAVFHDQARRLRDAERPAEALAMIERLRGYRTLEQLDRAAATPALRPDAATWDERDALLASIAQLTASGDDPARLAALERQEAALREELLAGVPAFAQLRSRAVDMDRILAAIAPDEALVVPVLGARSPWIGVLRRGTVHLVDLPTWSSWRDRIDVLAALASTDDPIGARLLPQVSAALLGPVARPLGEVRHLTVLPDPSVQLLPWARLIVAGRPLGDTHTLAYASSLRAWLALRERPTATDGRTVVVAGPTRTDVPALPAADRERARVVATAPADVVAIAGEEAHEQAVRMALTGPTRLVHFAAHAEVDAVDPERSAVLLAPADGDDGRLQAREVVGLDLDGAVVLLASCEGATGETGAEGVVGLAEAFLQAGARAVVASTTPVEDGAAAAAFGTVHEALATGVRLDEAVRTALVEHPAAGGLRVLGDGAVQLPGRPPTDRRWLLGAAALGGFLALGAIGWLRRRR